VVRERQDGLWRLRLTPAALNGECGQVRCTTPRLGWLIIALSALPGQFAKAHSGEKMWRRSPHQACLFDSRFFVSA